MTVTEAFPSEVAAQRLRLVAVEGRKRAFEICLRLGDGQSVIVHSKLAISGDVCELRFDAAKKRSVVDAVARVLRSGS